MLWQKYDNTWYIERNNNLSGSLVAFGTSYECINTCSGSDCENIYVANKYLKSSDGPFGSIQFMCEGDNVREVDAVYNYVGGNNGTCAETSFGTSTRNAHIGRLGVSCPAESSREYVYDDTYFECDSAASVAFDGLDDPLDLFMCEMGKNCEGVACTVAFTDLWINAYVPKFLDTCVEALVPVTAYPTPTPAPVSPGSIMSVRFQAAWANLYNSDSSIAACTNGDPTLILSCSNDASIVYIPATDNTVNCTAFSENELQCSDIASSIVNTFSSAIFECSGPRLSSARVVYSSADATCVGNTGPSFLQHAVTLGIYCDILPTPIYFYDDLYMECADDAYSFERTFKLYGSNEVRHMCSTSATFPISSTTADVAVIPEVAIVTDDFWLEDRDERCFTISSTVPTAPVTVPSQPISPSPLLTIQPTGSVLAPVTTTTPTVTVSTKVPSTQTLSPTDVPDIQQPVTSREIPTVTSSESSSPIGAIAGGIAGGVIVALIVIGFIVYRKRSDTPSSDPKQNDALSVTGAGTSNGQDPSFSTNNQYDSTSQGTTGSTFDNGTYVYARPNQLPIPLTIPEDVPQANLQSNPRNVPVTTTDVATPAQPRYEVNFKDQARSVIGQPQLLQTATASEQTHIPIAIAMDISGTSGGSNNTRSEPPGRRIEEA